MEGSPVRTILLFGFFLFRETIWTKGAKNSKNCLLAGRFGLPGICRNLRESAKICVWTRFVTLGLSPKACPKLGCAREPDLQISFKTPWHFPSLPFKGCTRSTCSFTCGGCTVVAESITESIHLALDKEGKVPQIEID